MPRHRRDTTRAGAASTSRRIRRTVAFLGCVLACSAAAAQARPAGGAPYLRDTSDVPPIAAVGSVATLGVVELRERGLMPPARLDWPTSGRFESYFGPRWGRHHDGIDVSNESGTAVNSAAPGVVSFAGEHRWYAGYGTMVIVNHGAGFRTRYAHLSKVRVRPGQRIERGGRLGDMGATGSATGVHLHFEVLRDGHAVNPLRFLNEPPPSVSGTVVMP